MDEEEEPNPEPTPEANEELSEVNGWVSYFTCWAPLRWGVGFRRVGWRCICGSAK
jgi:hypothetical protein